MQYIASIIISLFVATSAGASSVPHISQVLDGDFKLYQEGADRNSPYCDIHSILNLKKAGRKGIAVLSDHLEGICLIYIPTNLRVEEVEGKYLECGVRVLYQKGTPREDSEFEIYDYRNAYCDRPQYDIKFSWPTLGLELTGNKIKETLPVVPKPLVPGSLGTEAATCEDEGICDPLPEP